MSGGRALVILAAALIVVVAALRSSSHDPASEPSAECSQEIAERILETRFERGRHSAGGRERPLFVGLESGPPVLLLHELPGMTPGAVCLADRLDKEGFKVYLPLLFGTPGRQTSLRNRLHVILSRRWRLLAHEGGSPIVSELGELARRADEESTGDGVAVIGMCLTGAFPLELFPEANVRAAVLSQPSLPIALGPGGQARRKALGVSDDVLDTVRDSGIPVLAFRFESDEISPPERMDGLEQALGGQLEVRELPGDLHSVLSGYYPGSRSVTDARKRLVSYLRERMDGGAASEPQIPSRVPGRR